MIGGSTSVRMASSTLSRCSAQAGHPATSMVLDAIERAVWTSQQEGVLGLNDVVHQSDRGSHTRRSGWPKASPRQASSPRSVGAVGSCYDNALAEMIHGLYKTELTIGDKRGRATVFSRIDVLKGDCAEKATEADSMAVKRRVLIPRR